MTCSRVAIIHQGRVVATNTPEQLMAQRTGGTGYELEIEGSREEAQRVLRSLPGVQDVKSVAAELPEGFCRVRVVADGELLGRSLAGAIVGAGLGLLEMRRIQASLEDVFLQLTMEDTAEGVDGEMVGEVELLEKS